MKNIFQTVVVLLSLTSTLMSFAYVDTETVAPATNSLSEAPTQNLATVARDAADKKIAVSKPIEEEKNCREMLRDVEVAKYGCEADALRTHVERLKSCPADPTVHSASAHLGPITVYGSVGYSDNCRPLAKAELGADEAYCKVLASKTRAEIGPCP